MMDGRCVHALTIYSITTYQAVAACSLTTKSSICAHLTTIPRNALVVFGSLRPTVSKQTTEYQKGRTPLFIVFIRMLCQNRGCIGYLSNPCYSSLFSPLWLLLFRSSVQF